MTPFAGPPPDGPHPSDDLGVYSLGLLGPTEEHLVRRHLEECMPCRARVGELEGIAELLAAARIAPNPPPGLSDDVLASLPATGAAYTITARPAPAPGAGAGTGMAPGTAAGTGGSQGGWQAGPAPGPPAAANPELQDIVGAALRGHQRRGRKRQGAPGGRQPRPAQVVVHDDASSFVVRPEPVPRRALRAAIVGLVAAIVGVLVVLLISAALSPPKQERVDLVSLQPAAGLAASGTLEVRESSSGLQVRLRARGLASGTYRVDVSPTKGYLVPAGTFRAVAGKEVDVVLHTSATSGRLQVTTAADTKTVLLQAAIGVRRPSS